MQDIPAHICLEYLNGGLKRPHKEEIRTIVGIVVKNKRRINRMMFEIAYHIGYANSEFNCAMSETTYKLKKQWIRNQLLFERNEDGT